MRDEKLLELIDNLTPKDLVEEITCSLIPMPSTFHEVVLCATLEWHQHRTVDADFLSIMTQELGRSH